MLDPWQDRQMLLESLRPPVGYRLDRAIGTSYSLDLLALLTAPLAFTFFDWEDEEGRPAADPLALLESVRRHADRIHLFCQAGEIKLPPAKQRLVAYLERSVIQTRAPNESGIFHPKIWLVRYVADGEPVMYRLVCLSRNLTFDRSWDTVLYMDGKVLDRKNAISRNHPLGDFVRELPKLAIRPLPAETLEYVAQMAEEVRRVEFELPPDVDEIAFWPLGIPGYGRPPFHRDRASRPMLIVSPFLSAAWLQQLVADRKFCSLVSRPEQIEALPGELLSRFKDIFVLNASAQDPAEDDEEQAISPVAGLHAKFFIEDDGWSARIYTGSANATTSAFSRNVEFVVELVGKRTKLGIDAFLGVESAANGMRPVLKRFEAISRESSEEDRIREALESDLARARHALAAHPLELRCLPVEGQRDLYRLQLHAEPALPNELRTNLVCWPASLPPTAGVEPTEFHGEIALFGPMGLDAVSGFLGCQISAARGGVQCRTQFVLNLPLLGVPDDRLKRILASQLQDTVRLLRFLFLLLQAGGSEINVSATLMTAGEHGTGTSGGFEGQALFEDLVRGLVDSPRRVANACAVIEDLSKTPEGRAVVPESLLRLWSELKTCIGERNEQH